MSQQLPTIIINGMMPITLFAFAFALWLGLYLLAQDVRQPPVRYAGLGLVAYALSLGGATLLQLSHAPWQFTTSRLLLAFVSLPPLFWSATMISLLAEDDDMHLCLGPAVGRATALGAPLLYILALASGDFPYVVGLRPYSRRANHDDLAEDEREALRWLRRDVPQRTLYNWQAAAAELVARDLHERSGDPDSSPRLE